jgi:hypothetical protein
MERTKQLRTRKPPLTQPNGWEKSSEAIEVGCTVSEKSLWMSVFGVGKVSHTARELLNHHAHLKAKIPWKKQ